MSPRAVLAKLLFIVAVLGLLAVVRRLPLTVPQGAWRVVPYGIGGVAAFWTIERAVSIVQASGA